MKQRGPDSVERRSRRSWESCLSSAFINPVDWKGGGERGLNDGKGIK